MRDDRPWDIHEPYAGFAEACIIMDVSKQCLANWVKRKGSFPEPVARLAMGPIWKTQDLLRWKHDHPELFTEKDS